MHPDPAAFILRGDDPTTNANSPTAKFQHFLETKLQESGEAATVEIIAIRVDEALTQTTPIKVIDVRFTASDNQRFLSAVKLHGLIAQFQSAIERETGLEIVAISIDMCKLTRCDNGCQTIHSSDYVSFYIGIHAKNVVFKIIIK